MKKTDPFADLPETPAKAAAYTVQARMSAWISDTVDSMKRDFSEKTETAVQQMTAEISRQLNDVLSSADEKLGAIQKNLEALKVNFQEANLKQVVETLEQAVKEHERAVAEQKAKITAYGQMAGTVAKKALMSAL